jgi:CubicO group peptidase (beta-lactamase class C family)
LDVAEAIDRIASETDLSGVVYLSYRDEVLFKQAWGWADRAHEIKNTPQTRFGMASGVKGFTALAVMSLVDEGVLTLDTSVRTILGESLELIDRAVTVGHLLAHTSGIGDYLDEDAAQTIDDYIMPVPVHQLASTRDYLAVLRGHPMRFKPGSRFSYCNGGYVVLALVAEEVSGLTFYDLLGQRVFGPAEMSSTAFLRSDQLPGSAAIGYLLDEDGWRTNHLHLPVRGSGDGGAYSTVGDLARFWSALFGGRIVPLQVLKEMVRPHNDAISESKRYGLGFWLRSDRDTSMVEGYDAGVSFRSAYDPESELLYTVMSNTSEGAWPIVKLLDEVLPELASSL